MVFSSIPAYLDPPNWQQLQDLQQQGSVNENLHLPPLPPTVAHHHVSGGGISIRPGSMSDRARLAKIPQPEGPLKCPRCESTNTKFCYFNNYSLSQPRHFCKTCRRYWTRGGALRNVPVGGGCRRNKKSKSSNSKSSSSTEKQTVPNSNGEVLTGCPIEIVGQLPQTSQLPSMASMQNFTRFGLGNIGLNCHSLKLGGLQGQLEAASGTAMGLQMESDLGRNNGISSTGGIDQWRGQQFPFLAGFETPSGNYNAIHNENTVETSSNTSIAYMTSSSGTTQLAPVKMEGNREPNLFRSSLVGENNQLWGGNLWTDLSGLGSSSNSTSHLL